MADGIRHGLTILGTMVILGDGAIRGITADGTTHGTGILGTVADGTVAGMADGMADGMIRGIMGDGVTDRITSMTVTSSVRAAAEYTRRVCPRQDQPEEAASAPHHGARE